MFTNKKGCTVYERTVQNRSPTLVRHEIKNIYWQDLESQEINSTQGSSYRTSQNEALIFIPESSLDGYFPKVGDKITGEIIQNERPPDNVMTIMEVKNFLYGSPKVRHLEVTAK